MNFLLAATLSLFLIIPMVAKADQLDVYRQCDLAALGVMRNSNCKIATTRESQSRCNAARLRDWSENACSPMTKSSARTLAFMYDELALIDQLGDSGKIKPKIRDEKYSALMALINTEIEQALSSVQQFYSAMESQRSIERSDRAMSQAISILGGVHRASQQSNAPITNTYVLNGRHVVCTTVGSVTNCN